MANILVLTYWSYKDALIQAYTLPYIKILRKHLSPTSKIVLVTFDQPQYQLSENELIQVRKDLAKENIHLLNFNYRKLNLLTACALLLNFLKICRAVYSYNILYIHAWCTPAGGLGYILSVITGKKLILDSFEPHAEPMAESGTWKRTSIYFKLLFKLEKLQCQKAYKVIGCVAKMKEYALIKYGVVLTSFYHKPACVDLQLFSLENKKNADLIAKYKLTGKIVCVYAGKLGGSYLADELFIFFHHAEKKWGDRFRLLFLSATSNDELNSYCLKNGFSYDKIIKLFVPHKDVPNYMGLADFAITPFVPVPSKRYGTPIKTGEYWALGLPLIITPGISDDSAIISENNIGAVITSFDETGCNTTLTKIANLIAENENGAISAKIRNIAAKYRNFTIAEAVYADIYSQA
jgi:hypothetical protein